MKEVTKCPTCDAKMVKYKHVLNQRMAFAVFRFYEAGGPVHYEKALGGAGSSEHKNKANMQKIAYWGLIAKHYNEAGVREGGVWKITPRGQEWVRGHVSVPRRVITYRGQFDSFEGDLVAFREFHPYQYREKADYVRDAIPVGSEGDSDQPKFL